MAGLPDASGDFSGFWDDATAQTYSAAGDGLSRNMYLYPDIQNSPNVYHFGQVLPGLRDRRRDRRRGQF